MSDMNKIDDINFEVDDLFLAKLAAALIGVEYPGDEYFAEPADGASRGVASGKARTSTSRSSARVVGLSAWQSARIKQLINSGVLKAATNDDNFIPEFKKKIIEILKEEPPVECRSASDTAERDPEKEIEGVVTVKDILGEGAESYDHEPNLLDVEQNDQPEADTEKISQSVAKDTYYFSHVEDKPKKAKKKSNTPIVIPADSSSVEFSPKKGKYTKI